MNAHWSEASRQNRLYLLPLVLLLGAGACGRPSNYYLEKGNTLFGRRQFAEAELNYRKATQKDPNNGEAHYRAGLCELKNNEPLAALQDLDSAVRLMPDHQAAKRQLANLVLGAFIGDPARPQALYDRLVRMSSEWLRRDPQSAEGLRIQAYLAMVERRPQEAVSVFLRARQSSPDDEKMNLGLMDAYYRAGEPAQAEKVGLDYVAAHPASADVYDALYRVYVATNRPADAENILLRKCDANPQEGAYLLQLAGYYAGVRKKPEMDRALAKFLANPGRDPQVHLKAGDFYAALGDASNALAQYNSGVAGDADNKLLYQNRIARALLLQNKRPEAIRVLNQALAEHPDDTEARSLRAAVDLRTSGAGRQSGVQEFKSLTDQHPDDAMLMFLYAKALLETGDRAGAHAQLQAAVKRNPRFLEAQVSLADVAFQQGNLPETVQHAEAALQMNPNHLRARMLRASALLQQGHLDEAADIFDRLAQEVPESVDVRLQLAYVDMNKRKFADANAKFEKLLAANPKEWRALAGLVDTDLAQNHPEQALARLNDELTRSHGAPQVRLMIANTAMKAGKYDVAIENLRLLADQTPGSIEPELQLADIFRLRGDVPQAIAAVQKAALLQPSDPRPASLLVFLLQLQNRKQEAKQEARRALALQPDDANSMNNLAYLLADTGDSLDEALRLARKAVERVPDNAAFSDTLGYIYLKRDQADDALAVFDKLMRKYPQEPMAHYHLAMAWYQKGDRARAKSELARALQLNPTKEIETGIHDLLNRVD